VPVHVLRDCDAGVSQDLRHHMQLCSLGEHQRGARVPQLVRVPAAKPGPVAELGEGAREVLRVKSGPAARDRWPGASGGLSVWGRPPAARRAIPTNRPHDQTGLNGTHAGTALSCLPRRLIVPLPAVASRSPCWRRRAIASRT